MGLLDFFKKNRSDDGTYHRKPGSENSDAYYGSEGTMYGYGYAASFRITVQDVFFITGRGTVITGTVETGSVSVGDNVTLRRVDGSARTVTVIGIEKFRQITDTAVKGENVGILLRGVERNEVGRGDVLEKE